MIIGLSASTEKGAAELGRMVCCPNFRNLKPKAHAAQGFDKLRRFATQRVVDSNYVDLEDHLPLFRESAMSRFKRPTLSKRRFCRVSIGFDERDQETAQETMLTLPDTNRYLDRITPTPLVPVRLEAAGPAIWCKLEFLNPNGSTKDRIAKFILSKAISTCPTRRRSKPPDA